MGHDFVVQTQLNSGSFGVVYEALQTSTGKKRALKILKQEQVDAGMADRFMREATAASHIDSGHVVEVFASGVDDQFGFWMALELLKGRDLADWIAEANRMSPAQVSAVLESVCHALGAAHRAGIVHRDLKPENVFLAFSDRVGSPSIVKVLDFGIAKFRQETLGRIPKKGTIDVGSPGWLAPEQTDPNAEIDPRADVWALGLLAFFLLTGKEYWRSCNTPHFNLAAFFREMFATELASASNRARELGVHDVALSEFDEWFAHCVTLTKEDRFPDAVTAFAALQRILYSMELATTELERHRVSSATPVARRVSESPARPPRWLFAAVALTGVSGLGAWGYWQSVQRNQGRVTVRVTDPFGAQVRGARIYIDGEQACESPCEPIVLASGEHSISAQGGDLRMAETALSIEPGRELRFTAKMEPTKGTLQLELNRPPETLRGLTLSLNGENRGEATSRAIPVAPGVHIVKLEGSEWYASFHTDVRIQSGQSFVLTPRLQLAKHSLALVAGENAEQATIKLDTFRVSIDDVRLPMQIEIPAGQPCKLTATRPGFLELDETIEFEPDELQRTYTVALRRAAGTGAATPEAANSQTTTKRTIAARVNAAASSCLGENGATRDALGQLKPFLTVTVGSHGKGARLHELPPAVEAAGLTDCLRAAVSKLEFPVDAQGVQLKFPLLLQTSNEAAGTRPTEQ